MPAFSRPFLATDPPGNRAIIGNSWDEGSERRVAPIECRWSTPRLGLIPSSKRMALKKAEGLEEERRNKNPGPLREQPSAVYGIHAGMPIAREANGDRAEIEKARPMRGDPYTSRERLGILGARRQPGCSHTDGAHGEFSRWIGRSSRRLVRRRAENRQMREAAGTRCARAALRSLHGSMLSNEVVSMRGGYSTLRSAEGTAVGLVMVKENAPRPRRLWTRPPAGRAGTHFRNRKSEQGNDLLVRMLEIELVALPQTARRVHTQGASDLAL